MLLYTCHENQESHPIISPRHLSRLPSVLNMIPTDDEANESSLLAFGIFSCIDDEVLSYLIILRSYKISPSPPVID